jgi:acetyltransferase
VLSARTAHDRLARICHCDYDRELTLVAERTAPDTGESEVLGVGRMSKLHGLNEARFSLLISDCCQGLGIGGELVRRLIQVAREEKLPRIEALFTEDNQVMRHIFEKQGFQFGPAEGSKLVKAELVFA